MTCSPQPDIFVAIPRESNRFATTYGDAMKDEKIAPNKLYYSISEVSSLTDVKPYVLRFWEKEFPTLKPKKNRSGNRIYQQKEIDLIRRIKRLLYDEGYTIEGARQQLKNGRKSQSNPSGNTTKASLSNVRKQIQALIRFLS